MDVIYLAAPLSAPTREGIEKNRERAARWAAWVLRQGFSPVCSWITLTGVIPETPEARKQGLESDCAQVERCDALWYVGGRISGGMYIEGTHGLGHDVPAFDLTDFGEEPPDHIILAEEFAKILERARIEPEQARGVVSTARLRTIFKAWAQPHPYPEMYEHHAEVFSLLPVICDILEAACLPASADWTVDQATGRANSSALFQGLTGRVGALIRSSAHSLIAGQSDDVAGLILAQLAHVYGLSPSRDTTREAPDHTWVRAQWASAESFEKLKGLGRQAQFDKADCFTPYTPYVKEGSE